MLILCVYVCMRLCVRPSTVKASSVWIVGIPANVSTMLC